MIYAIHKRTKEHRAPDVMNQHDSEWRYVQADADGWIDWRGGECPLPEGAKVRVRYEIGEERDGVALSPECNMGQSFWDRDSGYVWNIIAYRPILNNKPSDHEAPEWDGESWPPRIGSVIESYTTDKDGKPTEVLAVRKGRVIGCHVDTGMAGWIDREQCRPLRSEEDRVIEEMQDAVRSDIGGTVIGCVARALYRAGYRKTGDPS